MEVLVSQPFRSILKRVCICVCMCADVQCMLPAVWLQQLHGQSHVFQCNACGNVVSVAETSS